MHVLIYVFIYVYTGPPVSDDDRWKIRYPYLKSEVVREVVDSNQDC